MADWHESRPDRTGRAVDADAHRCCRCRLRGDVDPGVPDRPRRPRARAGDRPPLRPSPRRRSRRDVALGLGPARRRDGARARPGARPWAVGVDRCRRLGGRLRPARSLRASSSRRRSRTATGAPSGYQDVVERIGERRLFEIAGLQLMPINTIFQVAAHDRVALGRARHLVMLPELLAYHLTGEITAELTSVGATGLFDLASGDWSAELADAIGLPPALLPEIRAPGTLVGKWRDVPVHLVGGHDTASAVLGGAVDGAAFVSAGTWLLVGRMLARPDTSEAARLARFSNEQGAAGGIRLLRNVAGWWLVEECRRSWGDPDLDQLLDDAARVGPVPAADATDDALPRSRRHGGRAGCGSRARRRRLTGGDHPLRRGVDGPVDCRRRRPARLAERPGVRRWGAIGAVAAPPR